MAVKLTNEFIASRKPNKERPYEIADAGQPGLLLRVQPSGVKSFIVQWGRGKRTTSKKRPPEMTIRAARKWAEDIRADARKHDGIPTAAKPKKKTDTLGEFIDNVYEPG